MWQIFDAMPFPNESIRPLPQDVVAKIKSSISITHLNGVIIELVKNSLDAGARAIDITVDYRRGGCTVDDDGHGILQAEFELRGGLGKAYRVYLRQDPLLANAHDRNRNLKNGTWK